MVNILMQQVVLRESEIKVARKPLLSYAAGEWRPVKLQLHDAIYWLQFYSNSLTHILSLSALHNNVTLIKKNQGNKSHRVIVALRRISSLRRNHSQRVSKYSLACRTISCHCMSMTI